ncbi:MAG: glycosyltransferase [Verrucomicrobia bacterium]|nr:glycosyltransferase [Verrucomicrobiota bacterium]
MSNPKASVIMPVWGRPVRTIRAMLCVINQVMEDWELIAIGDGCDQFQRLIDNGSFFDKRIKMSNLDKHHGSPIPAMNQAMDNASGEFLFFLGNDDVIHKHHLRNRVKLIDGTNYDIVAGPSHVHVPGIDHIRQPEYKFGGIGHSEVVVRRSFVEENGIRHRFDGAKSYGQDWRFISDIVKAGGALKAFPTTPATYVVSHIPGHERYERFD